MPIARVRFSLRRLMIVVAALGLNFGLVSWPASAVFGTAITLPLFFSDDTLFGWVVPLIGGLCRVAVRIAPRAVRGLVVAMAGHLVWILLTPGLTDRVRVPATIRIRLQTLVFSDSDPPQPRGDCFYVAPTPLWRGWWIAPRDGLWQVANLHAQNFAGIVRRLGLPTVEMQPLAGGRCLITDPRIPRDWLLDRPCRSCFREPEAADLVRRYPEHFRPPADR
jgi:hypothetical protein